MSGELMGQTDTEDKFLSLSVCLVDEKAFIRSTAASPKETINFSGLFTV